MVGDMEMNENKFTTLSQSKRLAKVFGDKAPEADGYWLLMNIGVGKDSVKQWVFRERLDFPFGGEVVENFRLDTLLLELPEILFLDYLGCFDFFVDSSFLAEKLGVDFRLSIDLIHKIQKLLKTIYFKRGKEAIAATVDLLELLKSEGLNE
jgi:hypothetical protein